MYIPSRLRKLIPSIHEEIDGYAAQMDKKCLSIRTDGLSTPDVEPRVSTSLTIHMEHLRPPAFLFLPVPTVE